jgi:glutamate decarboxylase
MPPDAEDLGVLRIVVRDGFNADLAGDLVRDIRAVCAELAAPEPSSSRRRSHFAH